MSKLNFELGSDASHDSQLVAAFTFGRDCLGPIIARFIYDLDAVIQHFANEKSSKILFASRAGLRIMRLYECFLQTQGRILHPNAEMLWISRFLCAKGVWNTSFQSTIDLLHAEFANYTLRDLVNAIYRTTGVPEGLDIAGSELDAAGSKFSDFIWGASQSAHFVRWHLTEQSNFFSNYIDKLVSPFERALIIDSGWKGTVQTLLTEWRPEIDWWGAYFGRNGERGSDRRFWDKMLGLAFECDTFDPQNLPSSIILHRHLIEDLFEPDGTSIEHLAESNSVVFAPGADAILSDSPEIQTDPVFVGVMLYISELENGIPARKMLDNAAKAWPQLARTIVFPTTAEAVYLGNSERSADFGRSLKVPLLLPPQQRYENDSAEARILHSLWPAAQAALEYPPEICIPRQQQICGFKIRPADILASNASQIKDGSDGSRSVAVITRTMDRPMFLRRALSSVSNQDYEHYFHVIVCDGGDISEVAAVISASEADKTRIILIDNVVNRGMEAASNIAIRATKSDFVIIHDDDDTWDPKFLSRMVKFLDGPNGKKYGGAISHTWHVSEEVTKDGIVERGRKPYHDWVANVQIMEMAQENFFAPIAFLFKREIYDQIGGFDERFPVLGDWDFNLRFLSVSDIGVVADKLANYHHRDVGNTSLFANSVVGSISKHAEYNSIMRNKFLRGSVNDAHLGVLVNLGMSLTDVRSTIRRTLSETENFRLSLGNFGPERSAASIVSRYELDAVQALADARWMALAIHLKNNNARISALEEENKRLSDIETHVHELQVRNTQLEIHAQALQQSSDERWTVVSALIQQYKDLRAK